MIADSEIVTCIQCGTQNRVDRKQAATKIANCGKCHHDLKHQETGKPADGGEGINRFMTGLTLVVAALSSLVFLDINFPEHRKIGMLLLFVLSFFRATRVPAISALLIMSLLCALAFYKENKTALKQGRIPTTVAVKQVLRETTGLARIGSFRDHVSNDRYRKYLDAIDTHHPEINKLANYLTQDCPSTNSDDGCQTSKIVNFVTTTIRYRNDPLPGDGYGDYIKGPIHTLEARGGDCEDLSILVSSLLGTLRIPTQLVFTPGHVYPRACFAKPVAREYLDTDAKAHRVNGQYCYDMEPTAEGSGLNSTEHPDPNTILHVIDVSSKRPIATR